jgi:TonB family protein
MSPLVMAMTISLLIGYSFQNPILENQAISRVQQISVAQLDAGLPDRPFGLWINQIVGPRAGVSWQLTDCGEQTNTSTGSEREIQACVDMTALLPDDRKIVVMTWVGGFKQGIYGKPKIQFAVIESKGDLFEVPRLRELPEMLRRPLVRIQPKPEPGTRQKLVVLPQTGASQYPLIFSAGGLSAKPGVLGNLPNVLSFENMTPPRNETRRVSEGVLMGNVLNKVVPNYPIFAKQAKLSGEVKVEVMIAEDGRVIEAKTISGPEPLRDAAEEAARKWIFKPTLLNGIPVRTQGILTFVFTRP